MRKSTQKAKTGVNAPRQMLRSKVTGVLFGMSRTMKTQPTMEVVDVYPDGSVATPGVDKAPEVPAVSMDDLA